MMGAYDIAVRLYQKVRPYGIPARPNQESGLSCVTAERANGLLNLAIKEQRPFCISRLGGVEAKIVCWGGRIRLRGRGGFEYPVFYWETRSGATNAGVRPRSRDSYRQFAQLASEALDITDILGVWYTNYEQAVIQSKSLCKPLTHVRSFAPTFDVEPHWMSAAADKKILVISPFEKSIKQQVRRMSEVWKARDLKWTADVEVARFPYLIDETCKLDWREVFDGFKERIRNSDANIVLCGCGGLGLLLAAEAKKEGKVGMHIGGFTQLLFGIHGKRHLEQEWHRKYFNSSWIRPLSNERAETADRVEGGCYW